MRLFVLGIILFFVAACSSSNAPTGAKAPPSSTSFDTLLTNASVPPSGGTLTVNKSGDPLNGLTMTVSSGAYSNALSVTLGSSTNKNVPTWNGIVPISPVVRVATNAGYANGAITFKIPATVPANTFPIAVWYDSATNAMEGMTTLAYDGNSVTVVTGHLDGVPSVTASGARVFARSQVAARGSVGARDGRSPNPSDSLWMNWVIYAVPTALLNQNWDTGFRPGTNDWEMPPYATEATGDTTTLLGVAATETWYFNTKAASIPLFGRFPLVKNASLSDRTGYRWVSVVNQQVGNLFNSFASSAYKEDIEPTSGGQDSLQFNLIRGLFAIAARNTGEPLPVLIDLQSKTSFYYLVAYKATGNQIYVADPLSPGDATRFIALGSGGMVPYVNPGFRAGTSFTTPLATQLGTAIPFSAMASSYANVTAGTIGNTVFPVANFYSWSGMLYDTMYVVDSLRFWAQCAQCQYGFASTLSPAPSGNVESSFNLYVISSGAVTDSIGFLGANGLLVSTASMATGTQKTLGVPLASADSAGEASSSVARRWLDWHQFTITNLQVTIAPSAPQALTNAPQSLQASVSPNLLPANVAYQWSFGDNTANVTVQNSPSVQHTYAKTGTFPLTVKIIDNRNAQVIGQSNTTVTVNNQVEVWSITSLTYLYTTVNGVQGHSGDPGFPVDTLVLAVSLGTYPTLVALNGPPFSTNYPETGFAFVRPTTGPQDWAQFGPDPLAMSAPLGPYNVVGYTNTGTDTTGTITGQAIVSSTDSGSTNIGHTVSLAKNGATLSGYIKFQYTVPFNGVATSFVLVDSVVAQRVP